MSHGLDINELEASRAVNVIAHLHIEDGMTEHAEHRDKARATVLHDLGFGGYSGGEEYARSNDDPTQRAPLGYMEPTAQTENGYVGLDPPMG